MKDSSIPIRGKIRRSKKRLFSGINFPVDTSCDRVKQFLEEKVSSGEIDIGESIVEREYKKRVR